MDRYKIKVAVYALLVKDGNILLIRRAKDASWQPGKYGLPAGHLEANESLAEAVTRETKEETGLDLAPESIKLVHTLHRQTRYIDVFFTARWRGEPSNTEPDKHDDLRFFPLAELPPNMIPSVRHALEEYQKGSIFSELEENFENL